MSAPGLARPPVTPAQRLLSLRAPGRLHLGFLDPSASLGRAWGSLGLVVDAGGTELLLGAAESSCDEISAADEASSAELPRIEAHLAALRRHTGRQAPLQVRLLRAPPPHAGFGSGTQLALAVGRAFTRWHGLAPGTAELAQWLGRGLRSGVGIAGFDQGGLLVDGGPLRAGEPAPLLARLPWPEPWRIVLVLDPGSRGLAGGAERQALAELPALPRSAAADICHQVLMRVLPGAAGADFPVFAAGVTQLQRVLGEHFAAAQGGGAYTSASVGRAVEWLGAHAGAAIGQSSWGPTGFAVLPSQAAAEAALDAAREAGAVDRALAANIVRGCNHGALVAAPGLRNTG